MPKVNPLNVILHIVGWTLFLSLPILFIAGQSSTRTIGSILASIDAVVFFSTYLFIFYVHSYFLFPRLYLKRKLFLYAGSLIVFFVAVWLLRPFDRLIGRPEPGTTHAAPRLHPSPTADDDAGSFHSAPPGDGFQHGPPPAMTGRYHRPMDMVSFFLLIVTLAFSLSLGYRQQARAAHQRALEATADKTRAELLFLKAQIQPHFLFNTLNNIYSLAVRNDPNTPPAILKLSNILRYTTDEASENLVSLESEVGFLHDYIDLQRLRLGGKMNIDLSVPGSFGNEQIAPLLLLTFVENAFKYGLSNHEPSLISIHLEASNGNIHFICSNKLFTARRNAERTGIGIANTRRRLDQLYPGRYTLTITENENYTVELFLPDQA